MAAIVILNSHRNIVFAHLLANFVGAEVEEEVDRIVISKDGRLEIPRFIFDEVFDEEEDSRLERAWLERAWRSLILNRTGTVEYVGDDKIIISDKAAEKSSNFLLRFPTPEAKEEAEEWAEQAGFPSLTAYVLAAIREYNRFWAKASVS